MSFGTFAVPTLENETSITQPLPGRNKGSGLGIGKQCEDLNGRTIPQGVNFVPGPDRCTLCICDEGSPKWCKAVLCSPPQDCKSFRVGNSCCDFICLDDTLKKGKGNTITTGGPFAVDMSDAIPKVVIASLTAMFSLSLLFFLVHRLRKKELRGRRNCAAARRASQMCDECDDTRSLDFSMYDFDRSPNSDLYPPQYLAWWKRPSTYLPPRGEAPPPYEEAIATSCVSPGCHNGFLNINTSNNGNMTILTNENINQSQRTSGGPEPSASQLLLGLSDNGQDDMPRLQTEQTAGPSRPIVWTALDRNGQTNKSTTESTETSDRPIIPTTLPEYSATAPARDSLFRHSLTLPRRPNLEEVREFGLDLDCGSNNYFRRNRQRFSLQLNVNVDDTSSCSSSMSLSDSVTPIDQRNTMSSSSSCSTSNMFP